MNIVTGHHELLEEVRPLWLALNDYHKEKSLHFKEKFDDFDYEMRLKHFKEKEYIYVVLLKDQLTSIGYVISSVTDEIGEIESLYISKAYRGLGYGDVLMTNALEWLEDKCKTVKLGVAGGNETALPFYEKYGFYRKVSILERK